MSFLFCTISFASNAADTSIAESLGTDISNRLGIGGNAQSTAILEKHGKQPIIKNKSEYEKTIQRANTGDPEAQNRAGFDVFFGYGTPSNPSNAAKWFKKASDAGNVDAKINLATLYINGWGTPKDKKISKSLLKEASQSGSNRATQLLGLIELSENNHESRERGILLLTQEESGKHSLNLLTLGEYGAQYSSTQYLSVALFVLAYERDDACQRPDSHLIPDELFAYSENDIEFCKSMQKGIYGVLARYPEEEQKQTKKMIETLRSPAGLRTVRQNLLEAK